MMITFFFGNVRRTSQPTLALRPGGTLLDEFAGPVREVGGTAVGVDRVQEAACGGGTLRYGCSMILPCV